VSKYDLLSFYNIKHPDRPQTNDEGNTFLLSLFVLYEHKHHGLEVGCTSGDYERALSAFIMNR
jgi:hypothetical protein